MEENMRTCDICGCEVAEEDGTWVDDQFLCQNCVDEHCTTCDHCNDTIWLNDTVQDNDTTLCPSCYDDHYHRCECCGRIIHDNDINWRGDFPYCDNCYDNFDDEIEEYSYKAEPIFYGEGNRFYGIELEVDDGGKDNDNAHRLKELANDRHEHIYIKSDGSLDDGFEIVSHPMSLDYHMNKMNWKSVFRKAVELDYLSHQTSTCGLHIHVNRNAFGDNEQEQENVISNILFFMETHWNEIYAFSRRSENNINRWAARYGYEKSGKAILDKAKKSISGRYCAVNLCNYHTIEFRIFRGTLKYNTFIAALQLIDEICNAAIFMTENEIEKQSWNEFVKGIEHKELIQYLKERRLYINDEVTDEEDI